MLQLSQITISFYTPYLLVLLNSCLLTKIPTEKGDEQIPWPSQHRTGSARSEGFYKISRKDKHKYLKNTKPTTELSSTSTQVLKTCTCDHHSTYCSAFLLNANTYFSRENVSPPSSHHCVLDLTSGLNSGACCPHSIVLVTWSSLIS